MIKPFKVYIKQSVFDDVNKRIANNRLTNLNPLDKTGNSTEVSTAVAEFHIDLLPPKDFAKKFFNIQQWTDMPKGGHYAAMEQPELLAADIRKFVKTIQTQSHPEGLFVHMLGN